MAGMTVTHTLTAGTSMILILCFFDFQYFHPDTALALPI
jgi:hypothetical protein